MLNSSASGRRWYQASRNGNGVGLTVVENGVDGQRLVIHVLPKIWRSATGKPRWVLAPEMGGTLTVFEQDYLGLSSGSGVAHPHALDEVADSFAGSDAERSFPEQDDPLWTKVVGGPSRGQSVEEASQVDGVDLLWQMLEGCQQQPARVAGEKNPTMVGLLMMTHLNGLGPLVRRMFIEHALIAIQRRKPVYVSRVDALSMPRGRVDGSALAVRASSGSPRVACEFETQDEDHAFWGVIRRALEKCAAMDGVSDSLREGVVGLPADGGLPTAPWIGGAQVLGGLSLSLDLRRLHVIALAIIHSEYGASPREAPGRGVVVNLKFTTSVLWEKMLELAFRDNGCAVDPQSHLNLLFQRSGESEKWSAVTHPKKPDLLVKASGDFPLEFIIDAKYMLGEKFRDVGKSDQYQAVAYALRSGRTTLLCFSGKEQRAGHLKLLAIPPSSFAREAREVDSLSIGWVQVGAVSVPFPSQSLPGWGAVRTHMRDQVKEAVLVPLADSKLDAGD